MAIGGAWAGLMAIGGARAGLGATVVARAPLFVHRIEPSAGHAALRRRHGRGRASRTGLAVRAWPVPAVTPSCCRQRCRSRRGRTCATAATRWRLLARWRLAPLPDPGPLAA